MTDSFSAPVSVLCLGSSLNIMHETLKVQVLKKEICLINLIVLPLYFLHIKFFYTE